MAHISPLVSIARVIALALAHGKRRGLEYERIFVARQYLGRSFRIPLTLCIFITLAQRTLDPTPQPRHHTSHALPLPQVLT